MKLLDETTVISYLKDRRIFSPDSHIQVEVLTGGISNVVLGISGQGKDLVLKQALPQLKVREEWTADQRRTLVEARAIETLHSITPLNVPTLVSLDPERFVLILKRAPRSMRIWKDDLLTGVIDPKIAGDLGSVLGQWHQVSSQDEEILAEFCEDALFEQLRIEPFYRTLRAKYGEIADRIDELIRDLESSKKALVHGDYSPKNILVEKDSATIILDYEVAHTGNPVFDLAFLLGHLLCKQEHFIDREIKMALATAAMEFISKYEATYRDGVAHTLPWHIAVIALARVDGKSPVNYLSDAAQTSIRIRALSILASDEPPSLADLFLINQLNQGRNP